MSTIALQNDAFFGTACGVDLLDGLVADVGCGTATAVEVAALGGNVLLADLVMSGADQAGMEGIAQTGLSGTDTPMLAGASALDVLGADVAVTGRNAAFGDAAPAATGHDVLLTTVVVPAGTAGDMSVAVVLHRLAMFSALAPAAVGVHTGLAR